MTRSSPSTEDSRALPEPRSGHAIGHPSVAVQIGGLRLTGVYAITVGGILTDLVMNEMKYMQHHAMLEPQIYAPPDGTKITVEHQILPTGASLRGFLHDVRLWIQIESRIVNPGGAPINAANQTA